MKKFMAGKLLIAFIFLFFSDSLFAQSSLFQPSNANFFMYRSGSKSFIIRHRRLTGTAIGKKFRALASGKRINSAADDAAGLAVAEKMNAMIKGLKRDAMNIHDYKNYLRHVEGTLAQNQSILNRIRVLILRSSNGILSAEGRSYSQAEIDQLVKQIDMNARFSQFNKKLIIHEMSAKTLNLDKVNVVRNLYGSMKIVDKALKTTMKKRVFAGVKDNTLTFKLKGKTLYMVNMVQSMSRISDQDMAQAMTELSKNNVMYKAQQGVLMMSK